jgi:hypothetical protein
MSPDDWPFSPDEIAETRRIISQTLEARGVRMPEEQIDVAMRRILLQAQASERSPIDVAREMVRASGEAPRREDQEPETRSE